MDLDKFIKVLYNTNDKIEAQRITEKWFYKHGYVKEWKFFTDNNITTSKSLYMYMNNESDVCSTEGCSNTRRFLGFRDGFKMYCVSCVKTKHNWMKTGKEVDVPLNKLIEFVKDKNGKYSTSKLKRLSESSINRLKEHNTHLVHAPINAHISEHLFNLEHNLKSLPKCKVCGTEHNNYKFSNVGYSDFCSEACNLKFNAKDRNVSLRKHFFSKYIEANKSSDEYNLEMFSEKDYVDKKRCSIKYTHKKCNHTYEYDLNYQGHTQCPKCFPIRSKVQYLIYDWLKDFTSCSFNDRKLIAPLELDILTDTFAIEYDSIMFHSFGKSTFGVLDNTVEYKNHNLDKTVLVEEKNRQLFRIFSNEYNTNKDIWKSVILSKLGKTERIHARKCKIKEIDSAGADKFILENHLQGCARQSIRLGLFYNNELVSVMTFGKSRYDKNIEYELIRFCSKLNTTVVGGASKLLRYFEVNYKPKSIISYANRRWSQGNLYEKLGFEFMHCTAPNYFYFKGGDTAVLKSRVQFQKHKLKNILEHFDEELTETENMFNNGYRKIYDCGNKVYVKRF